MSLAASFEVLFSSSSSHQAWPQLVLPVSAAWLEAGRSRCPSD